MPASRAQVRIASGLALALFLVFAVTLFFRTSQFPPLHGFVPFTGIVLVMADWITATLLFAQARVLRARPLRALALGYFFAGLLIVFRLLSMPGLGLPEFNYTLPLWFYLVAHAALPIAILSYASPGRTGDEPIRPILLGRRLTRRQLTVSIVLAWGLVLGTTAAATSLAWTSAIFLTALAALLPTIAAMVLLWRRLASVLDLWLLLMLWGWLLETILIALQAPAFTAGWYAARGLGLVSSLFVLFALLAETSTLYAQAVLQLIAQTQEREHRFLVRDVMSASIAHELRQPLSAILINAQVAHELATGGGAELAAPPDGIVQVLDEIVVSSRQANDILESTRAMFGRQNNERVVVDPPMILKNTLAMVASSARAHSVSAKLVVEGQPAPFVINRLQFQQALLNLFQNAIEALSQSAEPNRTLLVRCLCRDDREVVIRVEDNGPGIAPADRSRIFDAFFTTRPGGTGMGLLIARSVIRAHGGRLSVEARSPAGTAFIIHLPCASERPAAQVRERAAPQPISRLRSAEKRVGAGGFS